MKTILPLIFFSFLLIFSCTEEEKAAPQANSSGFESSLDTINKQTGECDGEDSDCYRILWVFPQFVGENDFSQTMNKEIIRIVASNLDPEGLNNQNMDDLISGMQEDFEEFIGDFPESGVNMWFDETQGEVLINNDQIISVALENSSFYGGAHPNSYKTYLNFSPEQKKKLEVPDLFNDTLAVALIVEDHFRKERDLAENVDLNDEGFFLLDEKFFLPASVGITEKDLIFYYNPYEIGPYSMGATEVVISREELQQYLKF